MRARLSFSADNFSKVKVRPRITRDGGQSLLAVGRTLAALDLSSIVEPVTDLTQAAAPVVATQSSSAGWIYGPPSAPLFAALQPVLPQTPALTNIQPVTTQSPLPATASPFVPHSNQPSSSHPRRLPARLKHFVDCLIANDAANQAMPLKLFRKNMNWLIGDASVYPGDKRKKRWKAMLAEAESQKGLIALPYKGIRAKKLKEMGVQKMIRLVDHGPFDYA